MTNRNVFPPKVVVPFRPVQPIYAFRPFGYGYPFLGYGLGYPFLGFGLGYGGLGYGMLSAGYGYPDLSTPTGGWYPPIATDVPPPPPDAPPEPPPASSSVSRAANITVIVPDGSDVWFEGNMNSQTGTRREYTSPALEPGYTYVLNVKLTPPGGTTRTVQLHIRAGDTLTFDLTK
jgi:uncharacterized protein (TIGR03000 family)